MNPKSRVSCTLPWYSHVIGNRELYFIRHAKSLQSCPTLCNPIHRWQPTRLRRPWDSPGKNTGVGCHFLLQCMKVKSESEVVQLYPTLSNPMDCSLPGFSVHRIFQARVLEWDATAFSVIRFISPSQLLSHCCTSACLIS